LSRRQRRLFFGWPGISIAIIVVIASCRALGNYVASFLIVRLDSASVPRDAAAGSETPGTRRLSKILSAARASQALEYLQIFLVPEPLSI
jgi:hypothetical protein